MSDAAMTPGRTWGDALTKWVGVGVALAGLIFGAVQFLEAKTIWRLERTTPYFERYESGEIGAARRTLAGSLKAYQEQFSDIEQSGVTAADRDAMMTSIFTADPKVGGSFDMIADFFQGMKVCVEAQLCDAEVTKRYFASSDAGDLWALAAPYVRYRRENNPAYADAFESFLGPKGAAGAAPAPRPPPSPAPPQVSSEAPPAPAAGPAASNAPAAGGLRTSNRPGVAVPTDAAPKPTPKTAAKAD